MPQFLCVVTAAILLLGMAVGAALKQIRSGDLEIMDAAIYCAAVVCLTIDVDIRWFPRLWQGNPDWLSPLLFLRQAR